MENNVKKKNNRKERKTRVMYLYKLFLLIFTEMCVEEKKKRIKKPITLAPGYNFGKNFDQKKKTSKQINKFN